MNRSLVRERVLRKVASSFYIGPNLPSIFWPMTLIGPKGADEVYPRGAEGSINMLTGLGLATLDTTSEMCGTDCFQLAFLHSIKPGEVITSFRLFSRTLGVHPCQRSDTLAYQLFKLHVW